MRNSNESACPTCGAAIPEEAPGGLCPKCALEGAASVPTAPTGGRSTPPPTVEEIAPHFPELEIVELMGAGGMGAVYKARQPQLDRFVAIKILSHDLAADPAFAERFNREARVLARLSHPNIVGVFDFGTAGPYCYLLMEYVDGVNLRQAMQAGRFSPAESLAMVEDICAALKFAHEEGILHRDIKPENVLIDSKGRVKIADFGIAKLVGESERDDVTLTMQGSVLGSPHYMAPEQIETPGDVDQRADIYSLGVVLYEMLTGELPIGRFAAPSSKVTMDARIDEIVMRTLEKEREARYQTAEEVGTSVGALAQSPRAARTAPAPVPPGDPGMARFSLGGAILTGLSLVGMAAGLYIGKEYHDLGLERDTGKILSVVMFILSATMAITGFIFGSVALGSIRKSGGEKGGLGSSVFAVVVWPVLFLGVLGTAFLSLPMPDNGGGRGGVGPMVVVLFIGLPQILAAFVLVRGLRRWARGVVTKDGEKRFPGIGRTILAAVGLIILGVVLLEVSSRVFPGAKRPDPFAEMEREFAREAAMGVSGSWSSSPEEVEWYRGAPEVVIPVEVSPHVRADFRLVRQSPGGFPKIAKIGTWDKESGGPPPAQSFLKIGTSDAGERGRSFTGLLEYDGQSGVLDAGADFEDWTFELDPNCPDPLMLLFPDKQHTFQIAKRLGENGQVAEVLNLEVKVTEQ